MVKEKDHPQLFGSMVKEKDQMYVLRKGTPMMKMGGSVFDMG